MRVLGLDIGTKNIGVAISDESGTIASGRENILRKSDAVAISKICDLVRDFKVDVIVVGLPINMDGTKGPRAEYSEKFAERLRRIVEIEVVLWDERLSTKEAEDVLIDASVRRDKRKKVIDRMAAQLILQGYLDSLRNE
ncbi:Holliday junction resolvase RuvX [Candidatus Omnitrophota bacterium]